MGTGAGANGVAVGAGSGVAVGGGTWVGAIGVVATAVAGAGCCATAVGGLVGAGVAGCNVGTPLLASRAQPPKTKTTANKLATLPKVVLQKN